MSIVIATGPLVTVNTIVGLPFIQAIQAIIGLSDNVADLRAFDAPPFPIEYRHATVHVPVIEEGADHPVYLADTKKSIIQEIKDLESYFSNIDIVFDLTPPHMVIPYSKWLRIIAWYISNLVLISNELLNFHNK